MKLVFRMMLPAAALALLASACTTTALQTPPAAAQPSPQVGKVPIASPTRLPTPLPFTESCADAAEFVGDISIPDNFNVAPNTNFTKVWRVKNTGTCTWTGDYRVIFLADTPMTPVSAYPLMGSKDRVAPGQTWDIRLDMTAPAEAGTYKSVWGITGANNQIMPITGGAGGNSFYVQVHVDNGVYTGRVTAYSLRIELANGSTPACSPDAQYVIAATVTADGPLSARVELKSDSGSGPAGKFVGEAINEQSDTVESEILFQPEQFAGGAGPQSTTIQHLFIGPYPDPRHITISARVNNGPWYDASVQCP